MFRNTLSAITTAADVEAHVDSFFEANELSWQNFKHICADAQAMIGVIRVGRTGKERMASCDVLALFHYTNTLSIKDSTSTFDGRSGQCG